MDISLLKAFRKRFKYKYKQTELAPFLLQDLRTEKVDQFFTMSALIQTWLNKSNRLIILKKYEARLEYRSKEQRLLRKIMNS